MNYWWVNQGFQFNQEKNLGCLWAPTAAKDGRTFAHWENMKRVQVGDRVFHYSKGLIKACSEVLTPWEIQPRPDTKGHNNLFSSDQGYAVGVAIVELDPAIAFTITTQIFQP